MEDKIFLKQAIIVEGKYDKIKLEAFVDALIITSEGFRIFKDKEKLAMIREIAKKDGVVILTDSDVAGFKLRNFIRSCAKDAKVTNIYIPQIKGKEKRKNTVSKQGLLGVEGMEIPLLRKLFAEAGLLCEKREPIVNPITRMDFYEDGLIGKEDSSKKRQELLAFLNMPSYLSTNSLLEIINRVLSFDEYKKFIEK